MEKVFIVSYDIENKESELYKAAIEFIEAFNNFKPLYNIWFIKTSLSKDDIGKKLTSILKEDGGAVICELKEKPELYRVTNGTVAWLKTNLG